MIDNLFKTSELIRFVNIVSWQYLSCRPQYYLHFVFLTLFWLFRILRPCHEIEKCTQKKRGTISPSLDALRSSTTYISQLQRVKPTPLGGSVVAIPREIFESVEVSKHPE